MSAPPPRLGEVVRDAEFLAATLIAVLGAQWDPRSGPSHHDKPTGPSYVDLKLGTAVAGVRTALAALDEITRVALPAAGSAVEVPRRPLGYLGADRPVMPGTAEIAAGINESLARRAS